MSAACVSRRSFTLAFAAGLAGFGAARAQPLSGRNLLQALRSGGYVLVVRSAGSPSARRGASGMGAAIRRLRIPIGEVWTSPAAPALQTVRLADLPQPRIAPELGEHGPTLRTIGLDRTRWLRDRAITQRPRGETNVVVVTQAPNIDAAFGAAAAGQAEGEALVFHPDAAGKIPVARLRLEDWAKLGEA